MNKKKSNREGTRKYGEDTKLISLRLPLSTIKKLDQLREVTGQSRVAYLVDLLNEQDSIQGETHGTLL